MWWKLHEIEPQYFALSHHVQIGDISIYIKNKGCKTHAQARPQQLHPPPPPPPSFSKKNLKIKHRHVKRLLVAYMSNQMKRCRFQCNKKLAKHLTEKINLQDKVDI